MTRQKRMAYLRTKCHSEAVFLFFSEPRYRYSLAADVRGDLVSRRFCGVGGGGAALGWRGDDETRRMAYLSEQNSVKQLFAPL